MIVVGIGFGVPAGQETAGMKNNNTGPTIFTSKSSRSYKCKLGDWDTNPKQFIHYWLVAKDQLLNALWILFVKLIDQIVYVTFLLEFLIFQKKFQHSIS